MKSLLFTVLTFVSLGVFANNEAGSISEETLLKVSKSLKENDSAAASFGGSCEMGFAQVTCGNGSTHSIYTSSYDNPYDALDALANNAYNRCGGGSYTVTSYEINQVPCL